MGTRLGHKVRRGQREQKATLNTYGPSLEDVFIKLTGLDVHAKGVSTVE